MEKKQVQRNKSHGITPKFNIEKIKKKKIFEDKNYNIIKIEVESKSSDEIKKLNEKYEATLEKYNEIIEEYDNYLISLNEKRNYTNNLINYINKNKDKENQPSQNITTNIKNIEILTKECNKVTEKANLTIGHIKAKKQKFIDKKPFESFNKEIIYYQNLINSAIPFLEKTHEIFNKLLEYQKNIIKDETFPISKAHKKIIYNKMKVFKYAELYKNYSDNINKQESCIICLGDFNSEDKIKKFFCGHIFHETCLNAWIMKSVICPVCKYNIKNELINYKLI